MAVGWLLLYQYNNIAINTATTIGRTERRHVCSTKFSVVHYAEKTSQTPNNSEFTEQSTTVEQSTATIGVHTKKLLSTGRSHMIIYDSTCPNGDNHNTNVIKNIKRTNR